jgi:hypothetical protein
MTADPKEGALFRLNYLRSSQKLPESDRARKRIYLLYKDNVDDEGTRMAFIHRVERQLGVDFPIGSYQYHDERFWKKCELGDFLSAITIFLKLRPSALNKARNILEEEDLHYRIDDQGGVHYLVDNDFHQLSESTLAGLSDQRFGAARAALQKGLKALAPERQSGKGLIQGVFEAVESTFLVIIGPSNSNRLNKQAAEKHLRPILLHRYKDVPEVNDKVTRMLEVFYAYVNDAHPYRHGAPLDQEHEAPLEMAILSATNGMGYIRFLAGL